MHKIVPIVGCGAKGKMDDWLVKPLKSPPRCNRPEGHPPPASSLRQVGGSEGRVGRPAADVPRLRGAGR